MGGSRIRRVAESLELLLTQCTWKIHGSVSVASSAPQLNTCCCCFRNGKKNPNNYQNSFHRNEKFPSKVNVFSSWSCRKKTLYSWNKHSCSQRTPCPQWHSCSVAHTALQSSSPDLYAHHFDLGRKKRKKEKPTCVFLLLVSGFLSSPCVSRAACILKAPHLMSPFTPDAARWASLLLFSAFFSFSKCHDSTLSLPTLGRFLSAGKSARCATDRAPSHPPVLSITNDPFHSDHSYSLYGPREFTLMFTIKLFLSLHILAAAGISSPDRTQLRMLARSPWCWGQTDGKRTALHHTDTGFCTHTLNRHRNTWHATRRHSSAF